MLQTFSFPTVSFSIPFKTLIWLNNKMNSTSAPHFLTSSIAAFRVPPVASTSSISTTLSPGASSDFWTSTVSSPYSKEQLNLSQGPGSFPFFLMGQQGLPTLSAREGPKRKPFDSNMNILLQLTFSSLFAKASMTSVKTWGSEMMGKMSMNSTPSLGKLAQWTVAAWMRWAISSSVIRYIEYKRRSRLNYFKSAQAKYTLRFVQFCESMPPKRQIDQPTKEADLVPPIAPPRRRKSLCGPRCRQHRFEMRRILKESKYDVSLRLCPHTTDNHTLEHPYPVYQNDKLHYTIGFQLGLDHKKVAANLGQQLLDYQCVLQRAVEKDLVDYKPRPRERGGVCNICGVRFEMYEEHVISKQHLDKFESKEYNQYLQDFCEEFQAIMEREKREAGERKKINSEKLFALNQKKPKKESEVVEVASNTPDSTPTQLNTLNTPNVQKKKQKPVFKSEAEELDYNFKFYFEKYRQKYGDHPPECICEFKHEPQPEPIEEDSFRTRCFKRALGKKQLDLDDFQFRIKDQLLPKRRKDDPLVLAYRKWEEWKVDPSKHPGYNPKEDEHITLIMKWLMPQDDEYEEVMAEIAKGNRSSTSEASETSSNQSMTSQKMDKQIDQLFKKYRTAGRVLDRIPKEDMEKIKSFTPSKDVWSRKNTFNRWAHLKKADNAVNKKTAPKSNKIFAEDYANDNNDNVDLRRLSPFVDDEETAQENRIRKKVKQQMTEVVTVKQKIQPPVEHVNTSDLKPLETQQDQRLREQKLLYKRYMAYYREQRKRNQPQSQSSDEEAVMSDIASGEEDLMGLKKGERVPKPHEIQQYRFKENMRQAKKKRREERRRHDQAEEERSRMEREERRRQKRERKLMKQEDRLSRALCAQSHYDTRAVSSEKLNINSP